MCTRAVRASSCGWCASVCWDCGCATTLLGIDPVLPRALDGLHVRVSLHGRRVALRYRVGPLGHGPVAIRCNGRALALDREAHPYRIGGVVVPLHDLRDGDNDLEVELG